MQLWQRMRTQTEAYWRKDLRILDEDIEYLRSSFLEEETPRLIDELTMKVINRRCRVEQERLTREAVRGSVYRPQETYEVGQEVVFPAFDYAIGKILSVRSGHNPKYAPFQVIRVQLEGEKKPREFASSFADSHLLNYNPEDLLQEGGSQLSTDQIYQLYGEHVRDKLQQALEKHTDFVQLNGQWFLKALLPEVHIGHLNVAEAMIDVAQRPLSTDELLREVDLAKSSSPDAQKLALEIALKRDERFDDVGTPGDRRWFLFSLEPPAVTSRPWRLQAAYSRPSRSYLLGELVEFVKEIGDELDEAPDMGEEAGEPPKNVTFTLNYPHWCEGTLPLTRQIRRLFPGNIGPRFPISFKDTSSGRVRPGWVLAGDRYAWGLAEWYRQHDIPVGGAVTVSRTDTPSVVAVGFERRQRRGEWVKEVKNIEGKLTFEMQRRAYMCPYDRYLLLHVADQGPIDTLAKLQLEIDKPLFDLILDTIPELMKLSSLGVFHAKTLYAAVNIWRRTGAVPIFAELTRRACFIPVGAGNWAYDPNLKDLIYGTEEEMRDRPYSQRADLIKDIVVAY